MEFVKKAMQSGSFTNVISDNVILRLNARVGDGVLTLGGPRRGCSLETEHSLRWIGVSSDNLLAQTLTISVGDELRGGGVAKKSVILSALKIA